MDDEAEVREVVGEMVRRCGYTPVLVDNGDDAVSQVRAAAAGTPFTLVLLDLTIPGEVGGREVVQTLLAIDPTLKAVAVSGYADDPILANHRRYGFVGSVKKPFELSELSAALQAAVKP